MDVKDTVKILGEVSIFESLSDKEIAELLAGASL